MHKMGTICITSKTHSYKENPKLHMSRHHADVKTLTGLKDA